jgi:hypothetical protein
VAHQLADALGKESDSIVRSRQAEALAAAAARMKPAEAVRRLTDALRKVPNPDPGVRPRLVEALAAAAGRMQPAEAAQLADALGKEQDLSAQSRLATTLAAVTTRIEPVEAAPRALLVARTVTSWMSPFPHPGNIATLVRAAEPLPCRLTSQQLVDLLKMPTCVGEAQAVILELLAKRYKRTFADQWDFVEFAETYLPDIDLKSPPKQPEK